MLRRIQLAGQWLFLRVEALFNLAFGDRMNPLYYLGPIAYFMLWIVVVTGLYLYAFFKTGVDEAYASVEYLTHQQWYLGGIMRSVHRYASDAMVLVMALHMARHFTFDRYRSFRWFSWVTGVILLWLVYASGINGYMLPWEELAQFTVIATAEWFDWPASLWRAKATRYSMPGCGTAFSFRSNAATAAAACARARCSTARSITAPTRKAC